MNNLKKCKAYCIHMRSRQFVSAFPLNRQTVNIRCGDILFISFQRQRKFHYDVMTLHCWMHWFWITLCTVIAVLPNYGLCLPIAVGTGSAGSTGAGLDTAQQHFPSSDNAVRQVRPILNSPPGIVEETLTAGPELAELVSAAARPSFTESDNSALSKPKTVYATLLSNKSNAENRALSFSQEAANRNRVFGSEKGRLATDVSFPVPNIDDAGDTEGTLRLGPVPANIDLKPNFGKVVVTKTEDSTAAQQHELDLNYNAVISDNLPDNGKATEVNECSHCSTTVASVHDALPEESANNQDNETVTVTDITNTETLPPEIGNTENITGLEDLSIVQEESTEEVLSRSSLTVQERREQLSNNLGQAVNNAEADKGMDPGAIAGISLGVLAIATLASAASFVLYRTRYLNNPQTLSDKCSNPDSSGYIDDSTMRENSEEMYSLDNDSFLNSLEAMTIQNYWTDSVKHTKL